MCTVALCVVAVSAQGVRQQRVSFARGASSAAVQGSVKGDDTIDYVLGARAGQTMRVTLKSSSASNYFNVLPPGSETAIANTSASTSNSWAGALPADGDYRIRVYLMRSAARRGESANYTLTVAITGAAAPPQARTGDAKVPGTPFHATGAVPCSVGTDARESAQCSFGVIRQGGGRAEVHLQSPGFDVALHKDGVRVLRFAGDAVTSANASEKVTVEKHGDMYLVSVNGYYFYSIPDAVIVGG